VRKARFVQFSSGGNEVFDLRVAALACLLKVITDRLREARQSLILNVDDCGHDVLPRSTGADRSTPA
jgi:hypothetical protein